MLALLVDCACRHCTGAVMEEPALSEGTEESTTRDQEETQEVSGEEMEVGYAEAAEAYDKTMPSLSSDEEADGEIADKEGQNIPKG